MAKKEKKKLSPELKELLKVEPTDAVFKISPEGKITAFMAPATATEFQKRMFFIVSAFLRKLNEDPVSVLKSDGALDLDSVMNKVMEEAKKLMSMVEDEDNIDLEAIKKKYQ
jgi:hypothetical protein